MRDLIDRMTACGVPIVTALCVAKDFERRGKLDSLATYVLTMEETNGKR
jgi:hypothetical protein